MDAFYVIGGLLAVGLGAYLVFALLCAEQF